ncbi:PspC domain-containing protein [Rheinheimera sp.]|uniref:PspC domain-containing protein n=1 Tax=Rheinheimera sp. TaxID=1869214 RepID=UPI00307EC335
MKNLHEQPVLTLGKSPLIAGVCAGLADYYGWSKNAVRVAFLISSFFFAIALIAYVVLWLLLPKYPSTQAMARHLRRKAAQRRAVGS